MKAMILAAGRGQRMRPLTDTIPKPLLEVGAKPLIVWHIENLVQSGIKDIVINLAHLGYKIQDYLKDGAAFNANITYSDEQLSGGLETAGGIIKALPLLGEETFLVINGDIFTDYSFNKNFVLHEKLAHLILVPNPQHNTAGDFGLDHNLVTNSGKNKYTFSGIGYYNPKLFQSMNIEKLPLAPVLRSSIDQKQISGELYIGKWDDIGTPKRLQDINNKVHNA